LPTDNVTHIHIGVNPLEPDEQEQLEKEVEETHEVKRLKSKFLDTFFENKKRQIFEAMKELPLGAVDDLNAMHMMLKSIIALESEVNTVMNTGKMAEMSLQQELDK